MALTLLSAAEQAAVDALVTQGRIDKVLADTARAATFLSRASDGIASVAAISYTEIAYDVAYNACHDIGEAVLAAYGYRTRAGSGQHEAVGRFLTAVFTTAPGNAAASNYDKLRRARNKNRYDAAPIGQAQVDHAAGTARDLIRAADARGVGT